MSAFDSTTGVSIIDTSDLVFLDFLWHLIAHSTTVTAIAITMTAPMLINTIARVLIESSSEFLLLFVVVLFGVVLLVVLFVVTGGPKVIFTLKLEATFVVVVTKLPVERLVLPLLLVEFTVVTVSSAEDVCSTTVRPVTSLIADSCDR